MTTNTATWLDIFKSGAKKKKCGFWDGRCHTGRRELPNGDIVYICSKCGDISKRISCYDNEREMLYWLTNKSDPNWPLTYNAFCNWIPKDPHIKKLWDEFIGYDSRRHHYFSSADAATMAEAILGGQEG